MERAGFLPALRRGGVLLWDDFNLTDSLSDRLSGFLYSCVLSLGVIEFLRGEDSIRPLLRDVARNLVGLPSSDTLNFRAFSLLSVSVRRGGGESDAVSSDILGFLDLSLSIGRTGLSDFVGPPSSDIRNSLALVAKSYSLDDTEAEDQSAFSLFLSSTRPGATTVTSFCGVRLSEAPVILSRSTSIRRSS